VRPYLGKKTHHKKGLVEWVKVHPVFKSQYWKKKKKERKEKENWGNTVFPKLVTEED
jgi:hypothetical protein